MRSCDSKTRAPHERRGGIGRRTLPRAAEETRRRGRKARVRTNDPDALPPMSASFGRVSQVSCPRQRELAGSLRRGPPQLRQPRSAGTVGTRLALPPARRIARWRELMGGNKHRRRQPHRPERRAAAGPRAARRPPVGPAALSESGRALRPRLHVDRAWQKNQGSPTIH